MRLVRSSRVKFHSKGLRHLVAVVLELVERAGQHAEVLVVGGLEHLALDDREEDLRLIEPAGVHRQVDEDEVRPAVLEPVGRTLAAVGGAVVDDPEHPGRGGIGLAGHHLPDETVEGLDSAPRL